MRGENGFHGRKQGGSQMLKHEGKGEREREREREEDSGFAISSFSVFFFLVWNFGWSGFICVGLAG